MERIEVIEQAAAALWAQHPVEAGAERIERLCEQLGLGFEIRPGSDVMLGGAYSRLQLWVWDQPDIGGIIWLRDDLEPETRLFAIAHELGHYALHRGEGISVHAACDQRAIDQQADAAGLRTEDHRVEEYSPRVRRELEASAFAAELLAPRAEVRRLFTGVPAMDGTRLAAHFGISRILAARRLIDAVLAPARALVSDTTAPVAPDDLIAQLDEGQREAARASGPVLVVAGPGTGKTATLVGRVAYLIQERHIPPEQVLALTFSNRAAGEMRARLTGGGLPGERMPIMTIHAFAATLLREYASRVPHAPDEPELSPDFHILDGANSYLLMEDLLGELSLHYYRSLGNPARHLPALLNDFSQARDELLTPEAYRALVDEMKLAPAADDDADIARTQKSQHGAPRPPDGTFTAEQIAQARERADAYAVWDRAVRRRGLVDFGGLIQRAVELLLAHRDVLAEVRARYPEMLVDEFQDTNRAAAVLLMLVAGERGSGLWVVGDQNQAIYRFRGASPQNLPRLAARYPTLRVLTLRRCYRAVPDIVRLGSAMAAQMAEMAEMAPAAIATISEGGVPSPALREALRPLALLPVRGPGAQPAIRRAETFASAAHERVGLAAAIERHRALGYAFGDQAVLCRTHKQVRQIADVFAQNGVPVSQLGNFFERPEIKDALMLLFLAAGPDARGLMRATPLLIGLGYATPANGELAATAQALSARRNRLPEALCNRRALGAITALSSTTRTALAALGDVASDLKKSATVGHKLAAFLLRPGGYAWRLARVSDGLDAPRAAAPLPGMDSPAQAQQALAALGELVRLAWRFDTRFTAEPEFRAQLSRAVTHRRPTRPADPDTLQGAPTADVALAAAALSTDMTTHPADTASADTAPAVSCFLHYLHALRATDVAVPVPAAQEDAVHVLTLHQSKGLEFPVVLLPGLAQGQFPAGRHGHEVVCPPGFRASDAPGEHEAEERCLFYVGVTRARDVVAFTRATSYETSSNSAPRTTARSSLLTVLDGVPGWETAGPLIDDDEHHRLLDIAATLAASADDEGDDDSEAAIMPSVASTEERSTFALHDLEQYRNCPRQYKYAHHYRLLDPAEDAVYRFHRFLRRGMRTLREVQATAPGANWQAAEAHLRPLWESDGPAGHAYDTFYWQAAEAILRAEWQAITAPTGVAASRRVALAQPLVAHLRHCDVTLTADRVIDGATISDGSVRPFTVLVRLHTGRPKVADKDDLSLPLYYLAHQDAHPDLPAQIIVAYTGGTLEDGVADVAAVVAGADGPRYLENVTEKARKDAEKYRDATRKALSRLDKLDRAALGILAGQFAPRPSESRCAVCAYCYVCPSDPGNDAQALSAAPVAPIQE